MDSVMRGASVLQSFDEDAGEAADFLKKLADSVDKLGPIARLRLAGSNPAASLLGTSSVCLVPVAVFAFSHQPSVRASFWQPEWLLILGGCAFSATTVWQWASCLFPRTWWKPVGYVLLLELTMLLSQFHPPIEWLGWIALVFLVAINAVATGCELAVRDKIDQKLEEALGLRPSAEVHLERTTASAMTEQAIVADTSVPEPRELARRDPSSPKAETPPAATAPLVLLPTADRQLAARERRGAKWRDDDLYAQVLAFVAVKGHCSTSLLQRTFNLGYNRAAKLVQRLEVERIIGPNVAGRRVAAAVVPSIASELASAAE